MVVCDGCALLVPLQPFLWRAQALLGDIENTMEYAVHPETIMAVGPCEVLALHRSEMMKVFMQYV